MELQNALRPSRDMPKRLEPDSRPSGGNPATQRERLTGMCKHQKKTADPNEVVAGVKNIHVAPGKTADGQPHGTRRDPRKEPREKAEAARESTPSNECDRDIVIARKHIEIESGAILQKKVSLWRKNAIIAQPHG